MTSVDLTKTPSPDDGEPERKPVGELQPLLPAWMRDRTQLVDTTRKATQRGAHRATWHLLRLPIYVVRLLLMSPRGLWRVVRVVYGILSDGQGHQLRVEAATGSDSAMWLKLRQERNERIHRRMIVAACLGGPVALFVLAAMAPVVFAWALGLVVFLWVFRQLGDLTGFGIALAAGGALAWFLPGLIPVLPLPTPGMLWLGVFLALLGLGWVGRPIGKPLVKPATVLVGNHGPLRAPVVTQALCDLGNAKMKDPDSIRLLMDVARHGPGYQIDVELPPGVTASWVMEKREELAAALRRELGCVWPSVGTRHPGHLALFVSDEPMSQAKQAPWPLLKAGAVNLFRAVPLFTDQRNRWVEQIIAYTAWIVGAVPRMGKTYFVRQFGLVAGLDVRAKVLTFDLKGTGDLSPLALFAHAYSVGDEEEEVTEQLRWMRWVRQEMRTRMRLIRDLTLEENPEKGKVTDALATQYPDRYGPIVVLADECQVWFEEYDDKAVREEFIAICRDLVKRGPALGIISVFATQKPDANSIPTAIADNASARVCFKVNGWKSNDQVLGTSSHQQGLKATLFAFADKGIAYFRGDGAEAAIVRTVHGLHATDAEKVALRARQMREAAGLLTGDAAGDTMGVEAEQVVLLDDCREVMDAERAKRMHLGELRDKLALLRPGIFGHLDNDSLGSMLRQAGVTPGTVWSPTAKRDGWGVKRESLDVSTTEVIGLVQDDESA